SAGGVHARLVEVHEAQKLELRLSASDAHGVLRRLLRSLDRRIVCRLIARHSVNLRLGALALDRQHLLETTLDGDTDGALALSGSRIEGTPEVDVRRHIAMCHNRRRTPPS